MSLSIPDENEKNWDPSNSDAFADTEVNWKEQDPDAYNPEWDDETVKKWELPRKPRQPQPGPFGEGPTYMPKKAMRLAEKFKESGLQIIVKMASIELTPEKPEFPAGGWHGQMNEHICATAISYVDSENTTPSSLSFCMRTSDYLDDEYQVGQDAYHWMQQVYGTNLGCGAMGTCLQNYGSVETREGRLIAFPNVFQHRVSSFRLQDATKPGHRRFIVLWLVDPNLRVISTANVPPQQLDW
ncbi:Uu.00g116110.m01.CDS01 [Anthostomella pinea]|uniref:Uu.00g116110.m01.CDS01 n=1 Tax=Anthostomella pinea TaxID=933095 RepID=A0AAI8YGY2_9PEZI|nr:Uu.00g116110.m01.CDS01 [Anthostomella pinea]